MHSSSSDESTKEIGGRKEPRRRRMKGKWQGKEEKERGRERVRMDSRYVSVCPKNGVSNLSGKN